MPIASKKAVEAKAGELYEETEHHYRTIIYLLVFIINRMWGAEAVEKL